jgi:hypothetical protein
MNNEIFSPENEATSGNWFKFKNVGDKVSGTFISCKKEEDSFNPGKFKLVATIESEGNLINVSLKDNSYFDYNLYKMKKGDDVGFLFASLVDGKPGMQKAKSIKVFHRSVDIFDIKSEPVVKKESPEIVVPKMEHGEVKPADIPF